MRLSRNSTYGSGKERLEREYNLDLITTAPSVAYEILRTNGEESFISSPAELPTVNEIEEIREPIIKSTILCPDKYVGDVIELAIAKRGVQKIFNTWADKYQLFLRCLYLK